MKLIKIITLLGMASSCCKYFLGLAKRHLLIITTSIVLAGCQSSMVPKGPPPPLPKPVPVKTPVKIAIVLGAGGTKGMAHIGVLEVLEQAGVEYDVIVAVSAGSIIGALYADKGNVRDVRKIFSKVRSSDIIEMSYLPGRFGFTHANRLKGFLAKNLKAKTFDQLKIPLRIVATDLYYGQKVVYGGGDLIPAIHASSAIPGVFVPVKYLGRTLIDGAVADPLPVKVALHHKPKLIIAVDVSPPLPKTLPNHFFGVIRRSWDISYMYMTRYSAFHADVTIKPDVRNADPFDDQWLQEYYYAGKKAALKALPQICKRKGMCKNPYWEEIKIRL